MKLINNYKIVRNFTNKEKNSDLIVYFIYRPLGFFLAACVFDTQLKPNQVTILKYFFASTALYLIFISNLESKIFFAGYILYFFSDVLDYVDGSLARAKKLTSKFGRILDTVSDHFFSSIFISILCLKVENILNVYFLILFLSVSWSQVYINTLLKFYKATTNKANPTELRLKYKKKNINVKLNILKNFFQKIISLMNIVSVNLNLIVLFLFVILDLLSGYLLFFFIYKSFLITLNLVLILKNNFNFLNTKDYE